MSKIPPTSTTAAANILPFSVLQPIHPDGESTDLPFPIGPVGATPLQASNATFQSARTWQLRWRSPCHRILDPGASATHRNLCKTQQLTIRLRPVRSGSDFQLFPWMCDPSTGSERVHLAMSDDERCRWRSRCHGC